MDLLTGYGSDGSSSSRSISACGNEADETIPLKEPIVKSPPKSKPRGKKLVSLYAILPAHILDKLSKGDYDSSDDDIDKEVTKPKRTPVHHEDSGISSFLSDLNSVPTSNSTGRKNFSSNLNESEPLVCAFLSSETVVTNRSNRNVVVNIHRPTTSGKPIVETVEDNNEEEVILPPKIFSVSVTVPNTRFSAPRESVPRPSSAPRIAAPGMIEYPHPSVYPIVERSFPQEHLSDDITEAEDTSELDKKRSRKEMEKALRSGNFSNLSGKNVQTMESNSNTYTAPAKNEAPRHHVKVAPVRMYDTKAGTDVLGANVSGKAKGKNQVNHLMASAAALELKESQGAFKPKSQKANAKRKYGW